MITRTQTPCLHRFSVAARASGMCLTKSPRGSPTAPKIVVTGGLLMAGRVGVVSLVRFSYDGSLLLNPTYLLH
jgi:hypothetical protein